LLLEIASSPPTHRYAARNHKKAGRYPQPTRCAEDTLTVAVLGSLVVGVEVLGALVVGIVVLGALVVGFEVVGASLVGLVVGNLVGPLVLMGTATQ